MKSENNVLEQDNLHLIPLPRCLQPACKTPNILHQKFATLLEFVPNSITCKGPKAQSCDLLSGLIPDPKQVVKSLICY